MRSSFTADEKQKLTDLKLRLMNAKTYEERCSTLTEIEHLLNQAKHRSNFISKLNLR